MKQADHVQAKAFAEFVVTPPTIVIEGARESKVTNLARAYLEKCAELANLEITAASSAVRLIARDLE